MLRITCSKHGWVGLLFTLMLFACGPAGLEGVPGDDDRLSAKQATLSGADLLEKSLDALQTSGTYQSTASIASNGTKLFANCDIDFSLGSWCQHFATDLIGSEPSAMFLQLDGRYWIWQASLSDKWIFGDAHVKDGYHIERLSELVSDVTLVMETTYASSSAYKLELQYDTEKLVHAIASSQETAEAVLDAMQSAEINGELFISTESFIPLHHSLQVNIVSETQPVASLWEMDFAQFGEPVEFPVPVGETLFLLLNDMFDNLLNREFDAAYELFSSNAKDSVALIDLQRFVEANPSYFTPVLSIELTDFGTTDIRSIPFFAMFVNVTYVDGQVQQLSMLFEEERGEWKVFRFDFGASPQSY